METSESLPPRKPATPGKRNAAAGSEPRYLIVTFKSGNGLPATDAKAAGAIRDWNPEAWQKLEEAYGEIRMERLISRETRTRIAKREGAIAKENSSYIRQDFSRYFRIEIPNEARASAFLAQMRRIPSVESAYRQPRYAPCLVNPVDDPLCSQQGYLDAAPRGIGVRAVWPHREARQEGLRGGVHGITGADGLGQELVDIEMGWDPLHPDLAAHFAPLGPNPHTPQIGSVDPAEIDHGTKVLGVICAVDNNQLCCGIVPHLSTIRLASLYQPYSQGQVHLAQIISNMALAMTAGGVLLIEVAIDDPGSFADNLPVEVEPPVFRALRFAHAAGVIVVEAAGNGGKDLDALPWHRHRCFVNPNCRDSGAILVAAGSSSDPHTPWSSGSVPITNIGKRVDCYAWGEKVTTLSVVQPSLSTFYFNGTSAAAAIVAGAALSLQGMMEAKLHRRLTPDQMRTVLRDKAANTASKTPPVDRIGLMPNLKKIVSLSAKRSPRWSFLPALLPA